MQLGMIGLGRMGANMVRRLMRGGHACVVYDRAAEAVAALVKEGATGSASLADFVKKLDEAARPLPHGAGGVRRRHRRRARAAARGGRHPHRRRQLPLPGRHRAREAARAARASTTWTWARAAACWGLERGYCLMIGGEAEVVKRLDPSSRRWRPGRGDIPRTPGREKLGGTAEQRLPPLRPERRRPLREDDPQRHRVRPHGGLRRRAEHPEERQRRQGQPRDGRRDDAAPQPRALPVRLQPGGHHRAVAARQRGHVLAARPDGAGPRRAIPASTSSAARSPTPAKAAGRWPAANDEGVPAHVLTAALFERFASRGPRPFQNKVLSAMRFGFGGHVEKK